MLLLQKVEIVRWYLESRDDISSHDELTRARFTINQIIKRLVEKDTVLIIVESNKADGVNRGGGGGMSDTESVKSGAGSDGKFVLVVDSCCCCSFFFFVYFFVCFG